jgi:GH25 family lysozyme M1 (1,4-beta-N-acetylmuramidase)
VYYHFARSGDPVKQAERLLDAVGQLRDYERLALDLEVATTPRPQDTLSWTDVFFDTLDDGWPDRRHLIYTNERFWRSIGNPDWDRAAEVDLWIPRYSDQEPLVPKPWSTPARGWVIWQNTDQAVCPGFDTFVDGDVFYGDAAELTRYAKLG